MTEIVLRNAATGEMRHLAVAGKREHGRWEVETIVCDGLAIGYAGGRCLRLAIERLAARVADFYTENDEHEWTIADLK
jgi:hypothetical protein